MKYFHLLLVFICIAIRVNYAFATTCGDSFNWPYDVETVLPFNNHAANNGPYDDGICFRYQFNANSKKIICNLVNFNKGWALYKDNNTGFFDTGTSDFFTGNVTVIFTSTGKSGKQSDNAYQFHVDDTGSIVFHHDINYDATTKSNASISCSYGP